MKKIVQVLYGTTHLYNGQEAIATAICDLLSSEDMILSTHRNHGHAIAKGTKTYLCLLRFLARKQEQTVVTGVYAH
jgi:pyruvate dehydrogenase E1 component alpha subunit